jgi:hypothetical protein
MTEQKFDVFLCHNSEDKSAVIQIAQQLRQHNLRPWLDEWELQPGLDWQDILEEQIGSIGAAAVFVGNSGIGPWQNQEIKAFLRVFSNKPKCPVIPVLLSDAPLEPKVPLFLGNRTWVDFRRQDPSPLGQLVWGVTGIRPQESLEYVRASSSKRNKTFDNLEEVWKSVIPQIESLGTRALMQQQGHLAFFDGSHARIGIDSKPLLKMAQGHIIDVEEAFETIFEGTITVSFEIIEESLDVDSADKNVDNKADLEEIWDSIISEISPLGTRALMQQQGHLLSFDGSHARIGIESKPLFKMAQGRIRNVEEAFKAVFKEVITISLEVIEAKPETTKSTPSPPALPEKEKPIESDKGKWQVSNRIVHKTYGIGEVTHIFGSGSKICLAVQFPQHGRKILDPAISEIKLLL